MALADSVASEWFDVWLVTWPLATCLRTTQVYYFIIYFYIFLKFYNKKLSTCGNIND